MPLALPTEMKRLQADLKRADRQWETVADRDAFTRGAWTAVEALTDEVQHLAEMTGQSEKDVLCWLFMIAWGGQR